MVHMEQNSYKTRIINELVKGENHIRGLAKLLWTNHMTVKRRLDELISGNVVDFKKEGRNKVFFIKKSAEARESVFIAEKQKVIDLLKRHGDLRVLIDAVQSNKSVSMAVIFGSYVKGNEKKESDIDVYIDTDNRKLREEIRMIDSRLSVKIGKYDKSSLLIKEIEKNHVIIKGVELFYEKNKFFEQT